MDLLENAPLPLLAPVDVVLTDVDDTLTHGGRLAGETLTAMDRLQQVGVRVIPVTAASAGWCHLMAHMWPVDAVIGENGGIAYLCNKGKSIQRLPWDDAGTDQGSLSALQHRLQALFPDLRPADDDDFRLTCLAFQRLADETRNASVLARLQELGASGTVNSYWLLAWLGNYDKLSASRRLLQEQFSIDIETDQTRILFCGDSENDEPMFRYFAKSLGVSTVVNHGLQFRPRWIAKGPGGAGFVEMAERILQAKALRDRGAPVSSH